MKKLISILSVTVLLFSSGIFVNAAEPYVNYTYDYSKKAQAEPSSYTPKKIITGKSLEIDDFKSPSDVFVSKSKEIYIADSGNNRIIILKDDLSIKNVIKDFYIDGVKNEFNNPQGVFVTDNNTVYVMDTENGRIVVFNSDLKFVKVYGFPKSPLLTDTFDYKPIRMTIDNAGRIYIVSLNVNQGIIELDPKGDFLSFYGAVPVTPSISQIIRKFLPFESLKEGISLNIPTEYSSVAIDSKGFIFGTVGIINPENFSTNLFIHRLNPSGADVLRRTGINAPMGDVQLQKDEKTGAQLTSYLVDVAIRDNGIYSVLDKRMGRIFTYSFDGELMYVFGGIGSNEGQLGQPVALDVINGNEYLVVDNKYNQIVIYEPTEYATNITKAIESFYNREFDKSGDYWLEALKFTAKSEMVYNGVAKSEYKAESYESAMKYYKLAQNRTGYSTAFKFYRGQLIEKNFMAIFILVIAAALFIFLIYLLRKKRKTRVIKTNNIIIENLKFAFFVIFHPFKGFWDLKHEKRGTVTNASIIVSILVFVMILRRQVTGFLVNSNDINDMNIIIQFSYVILPFVLWCISNWAITTLIDGEGSFKDIYIASAYALIPLIIINIPMILMSNVFILEEMSFYYLFDNLAIIWTICLAIVAIMTVHQFTVPKTIASMLIAVVGMAILIAIALLLVSLMQQLYNFSGILIKEIQMRN